MKKIIFFELNEVPWRVMDWYCDLKPNSAFSRVREFGQTAETISEDLGDLHPWVTWPSLHRGVSNNKHGIEHLGQDLKSIDNDFPSIWRLLSNAGFSVGVGGSLQSFPLPAQNGNYLFYIPDTYSPSPETIPQRLSSFQDANLKLTKQNSRNVSSHTNASLGLQLATSLPGAGVRAQTALQVCSQLILEKMDKTKLNRRRAIQSTLYFDVFRKQLNLTKPDFCTFFTNHVAASMHRFWAATFIEDYKDFKLPESWVKAYGGEVEWAMDLADSFARELISFCMKNADYHLVILSSMGQAATEARIRSGIYVIRDIIKFFQTIGINPGEIRPAMAMAPDISVHLLTEAAVSRVRTILPVLLSTFDYIMADIDEKNMLHLQIMVEPDNEKPLPRLVIENTEYELKDAGFEFLEDQDKVGTTAYHIPEGIFMSWDSTQINPYRQTPREQISNLTIAPTVLANYGATIPSYMRKPELLI